MLMLVALGSIGDYVHVPVLDAKNRRKSGPVFSWKRSDKLLKVPFIQEWHVATETPAMPLNILT